MRSFFAFLLISMLVFSAAARAEGTVLVGPGSTSVDLQTSGTSVAAQRRNVALEVPGENAGERAVLELHGKGPGPDFNWTVYTINNDADVERSLVLSVEDQRWTSSGLTPLKLFGPQIVSATWTDTPERVNTQISAGSMAYAFSLKPHTSLTFGLEGAAELKGVAVFDQKAFLQRESSLSFLRGAMLAVTLILALGICALYGMRSHRAFLSGGFFAFAALVFMSLEAGYLSRWAVSVGQWGFDLQHMRAVSEALFALGTAICVWGLTSLSRRESHVRLLTLGLVLSAVVIIVLSLSRPLLATSMARAAACLFAGIGFSLVLRGRNKEGGAVDYSLLFWSSLCVWMLFAAVAAGAAITAPFFHAVLLAGLTAVVCILAFGLARFAFTQRFLTKPFMTDASRRSLALAGAQHFLWDWHPDEDVLEVGNELAAALRHEPARISGRNAGYNFMKLIHPDDLSSYRKILDMNGVQAGEFSELEMRLANADGIYEWFALRVRALPGALGKPGRMIGTLTNISRTKQNEDKLITEAVRDPVTGLPSRALFLDRLEREINKPLGFPVQVLLIGLERFKALNDGLGHDLGDQLLLEAGQRIAECLSSEETLARISGSQFAVMFVEMIDDRDALSLADDLLTALGAPIQLMQQEVFLSASIGISRSSREGFEATELQSQAASALHEAQAQGSRTIMLYESTMKDERADKLALEAELRRAIDRHEIAVHYQPIVHLDSREIAGLEALARWNHPERGILGPSEFIGMAEQAGMIGEVGDIVLAEATRQVGIWQRVLTRDRPFFVAINVSADQLSDATFVDKLGALINREGLHPQSIKIEITESVVMRFPERARQLISRLRAMGVGVACDDFGTGFSNLASLRDLQFDTLKMDRSFIMAGGLQGRGGVILNSVVTLAHSLNMYVVAEGIEDEAQAQGLTELGCDMGQGYLLGLPMPARDVQNLLVVLPVYQPEPVVEEPVAPPPTKPAAAPRTMFVLDDLDEDEEPEELPSIFTVGSEPPPKAKKPAAKAKAAKPKKKKPAAKKAVVKKPAKRK